MLVKSGRWNWRDFYRWPLAEFMEPFVAYSKDERYWAAMKLSEWGYKVI